MFSRVFQALGGLLPTGSLLSPDQFTAEFVKELQKTDGNVKMRVSGPLEIRLEENDQAMFLENLYRNYLSNPRLKRDLIQQYLGAMLGDARQEKEILPRDIVPLIKDAGYVDEIKKVLKEKTAKENSFDWVYEPLNEENNQLVVVYAVDHEKSLAFLRREDLATLHLQGQTLRALATDNLRRIMPQVECRGAEGFFFFAVDGTYEASLLCLDTIWDKTKFQISGEIVVAVPARDSVFMADSARPEAVAHLRKAATEISQQSAYRLTDKLFVHRNGKFVPFEN